MHKVDTSPEKINDFLTRGVKEIITEESVTAQLESGRVLRIKHGVDPSGQDLHLGHAAIYFKLRDLQNMGHKIVFLIGGFTGRFGDPTEKTKTRVLKSKKETETAARDYMEQVGKILDIKHTEIRTNSEWYDNMSAEELLRLMSNFTADQVLERDMFQERKKRNEPIQLHELIYPILQGYDSVVLKSDLTVVGTDQIFNESFGRELQKKSGQKPQGIVAIPILKGTDGSVKMGKSLNNYISITESPENQFGKIMSLQDDLIIDYFTMVTRIGSEEINKMAAALDRKKVNPRDLKQKLAEEIVSFFHSPRDAEKASKNFTQIFSKKEIPQELPLVKVPSNNNSLIDMVMASDLVKSKSEARRLIEDGAVDVDGITIKDPAKKIEIGSGLTLKIGKHRFIKIVPRN